MHTLLLPNDVFSDMLKKQIICHNYCKKIAFMLWYGCGCVSLGCFYQQSNCCRMNKFMSKCFQMSPQITVEEASSHWLHLFDFCPICVSNVPSNSSYEISRRISCIFYFSSLCVFKCVPKLSAHEDTLSYWLYLFDFSPLCVFICLLKWPVREDAKSHWLHFFYLM